MLPIEAPEMVVSSLKFLNSDAMGIVATKGDLRIRMTIGRPNVDSCDCRYIAIILYKDGILDQCEGNINKFNTTDQVLKELFRRHE